MKFISSRLRVITSIYLTSASGIIAKYSKRMRSITILNHAIENKLANCAIDTKEALCTMGRVDVIP